MENLGTQPGLSHLVLLHVKISAFTAKSLVTATAQQRIEAEFG